MTKFLPSRGPCGRLQIAPQVWQVASAVVLRSSPARTVRSLVAGAQTAGADAIRRRANFFGGMRLARCRPAECVAHGVVVAKNKGELRCR
jgi:hypothetical protein